MPTLESIQETVKAVNRFDAFSVLVYTLYVSKNNTWVLYSLISVGNCLWASTNTSNTNIYTGNILMYS